MEKFDDDDEDVFEGAMAIGSETTEAEKEFSKILELLRDAEGLKMYADVYTKLYDSYFNLKEQNTKNLGIMSTLQDQVDRFDETMESYRTELADALKTIEHLRAEVTEARTLADAMHTRELLSVESLETMKRLVYRLEKELEARKKAGDDDEGATSAVKEKEKFEKEKVRLQGELDALALRLTNSTAYIEELEKKCADNDEYISKLEEQLEEADNNAVRTGRLVDHLKNETDSLKKEIDTRGATIGSLNDKISKLEKTLDRRDKQLKEMTQKMASAMQEMETAVSKASYFKEQNERMNIDFEKTKQELSHASKELKNMIDDCSRLRMEISKLNKTNSLQIKKLQLLEQSKSDVETDRERLRQQVLVMERELQLANKQAETDKRDLENQQREKDILTKNLQKIQNEAQDNLHMLNLQDQRRKQLEHEIDLNTKQINKQRLVIRQMEKEKDRMLEEAIALNEKIDEITEEVRVRTSDILDLKKVLREENNKARKLSVTLDACRTERNMLHKNYTEALDEIQDTKMKLKMLAYQIEQMKEDVVAKETGLKSCEGALTKANKRIEMLKNEVQSAMTKLSDAKADIAALRQEEARLSRIIQESDAIRAKLHKELEGLMNERDVIGAQLVRRNDEITLLYEKIRILEITLQRGERQYESRVDDIRLLRLEIQRLRKEKNLLSKGIENMTDLRLEVFNLERELGRERLRVRALEEALETPLNVHRWRKLQGTDPESVALSQKLRIMQKKVLSQSEALVIKDRELKETKNLYNAVKEMLALQPSPEIKQTLLNTQKALANRTSKMKCLIAEVSMRERQVTDLRHELDRINDELVGYKQKYYEMKRALDADEARRLRVPSPPTSSNPNKNGGGVLSRTSSPEKLKI